MTCDGFSAVGGYCRTKKMISTINNNFWKEIDILNVEGISNIQMDRKSK